MKKLILDYSKWRCGNAFSEAEPDFKYSLGKGRTALRNKYGFECCLGQFCKQINPETSNRLLGTGEPHQTGLFIERLTTQDIERTDLSNDAININDDESTTIEEKIILLTNLFRENGFEIEVINKP